MKKVIRTIKGTEVNLGILAESGELEKVTKFYPYTGKALIKTLCREYGDKFVIINQYSCIIKKQMSIDDFVKLSTTVEG